MPFRIERLTLKLPRGFRSKEAALFIAEMDDLTSQMKVELRGLTVRDLEWQPAPGMNTIGMLLAHLALVETWWILGPALGNDSVDFARVLGIRREDDGIPLAPRGGHPAALRGRPLAWYLRLLARARREVTAAAKSLDDRAVLEPRRRIHPKHRTDYRLDARWAMYHVLEHFAGHYGQILLLKHARRALPRRSRA